jgi:hypothetical protein
VGLVTPLLLIGLGVVILGAVVLLVFPNRPGGTIRLPGGGEVNSAGAGLPLIVVGVVAVGYAATHRSVPPLPGPVPVPVASSSSAPMQLRGEITSVTLDSASPPRFAVGVKLEGFVNRTSQLQWTLVDAGT